MYIQSVRKNGSDKVFIFRRQRIYNINVCEYQACLKQTDELSVISVFTMAYKTRGRESGMSGKTEVSNWASHCECWRNNVVCSQKFFKYLYLKNTYLDISIEV